MTNFTNTVVMVVIKLADLKNPGLKKTTKTRFDRQ